MGKFVKTYREFLSESRDARVKYKETFKKSDGSLDEVSSMLPKNSKIEKTFNEFTKSYAGIKDQLKELEAQLKEVNEKTDIKKFIEDNIYDNADMYATNVIETNECMLKLSKPTVPKPKKEVNYDELLSALAKKYEILDAEMKKTIDKFTSVVTDAVNFSTKRIVDYKVKESNDINEGFMDSLKAFKDKIFNAIKSITSKFKSFSNDYSRQIRKLDSKIMWAITSYTKLGESKTYRIKPESFEGNYVNLTPSAKGVTISLTRKGKEELQELWDKFNDPKGKYSYSNIIFDLFDLDNIQGNSEWQISTPEWVGALTDSIILTYGNSNPDILDNEEEMDYIAYWYPDYQVKEPFEELLKNGEVFFTKE